MSGPFEYERPPRNSAAGQPAAADHVADQPSAPESTAADRSAAPRRITTVLASASPARLAVLRAAGIDPVVRVSGIDERALEHQLSGSPPAEIVAALAAAKAEAVATQILSEFDEAVVIGCDSMLLFRGRLFGKPIDESDARRQWAEMSGSTGDLLTGHVVLRVGDGRVTARAEGTERTVIRFGTPTAEEVSAYLATGEPLDVAGSLTIDGYGGWFVDGVDGDPSSVIGISLPLTRRLLARAGIGVIRLWREAIPAGAVGRNAGDRRAADDHFGAGLSSSP